MCKVWFLILGLFCISASAKENIHPDTRHLYEELNLKEVVSRSAFEEALKGYQAYKKDEDSLLTLIDFTKPSREKRFCVIDLKQKQILFKSHVAHGRNSGDDYAVAFSNRPGSFQSSLGFYRTGNTYYGKNGYSLILDGLEKGKNDKAKERAIVIHGAKYADPAIIKKQGRLGRSLGCPALPPAVSRDIIDSIKQGTLLYIYGIS